MKGKLFLLLFALCAVRAYAVDKTWTGTGVWSNASMWTPVGVPGVNDRVFFTGNGTCDLDVNVQVAHFEFQSSFSGVFNQNAFRLNVHTNGVSAATGMFLDGSGTFNGGTNNITLGAVVLPAIPPYALSHFTLGGTVVFNSTSDTFLVHGDFTRTTGTFSANSLGWVVIRGGNGITNTISGSITFSKIDFKSTHDFDRFDLSTSTDLIVLDTMAKTGMGMQINTGDIFLKGDLIINYMTTFAAQNPPYGNARIYIDGTTDQHIVGKAATYTMNFLENIYIDKPSGTLFLHNYITVGPDWRYLRGTIDAGTSTVFFYSAVGTVTISGSHTLSNVRFGNLAGNNVIRTIQTGTVLTVSNKLEFDGNNNADVYDGTIHAQGDIVVTSMPNPPWPFCGGTTTIVINGVGTQTLEGQTQRNRGYLPNIVIDKPSGILFLKDTINVERSWIYVQGTVDAITQNSYVNFVGNRNFFNLNDLPVTALIDGEGASATMLFNNVGIDNPVYLTQIKRTLIGNLRVQNILDLRNHQLELNGNDLFIENAGINSIKRTTGVIISETTPATSISSVHWFINTAPAGTSYTFPFATSGGNFIPFTLTVGTPGTPAGTGSVSIATYPTDPSAPLNNRPLPPGVTNINSFIGNDNAPRELDRYWIYGCNNYTTTPVVSLNMIYLESEWNGGSNNIDESLLRAHQWNPNTLVWDLPTAGALPVNTAANIAIVSNVTTCSAFTLVDPTLASLVFFGSDTMVCAGEAVTFMDAPPPPATRQWFFPGGTPNSSTAATPVVTYNTPGVYDVLLSATYPGGMLRDTLHNYITVSPALTTGTLVTDATCQGNALGSANTIAVGGATPYSYVWSNGDTTQSINAAAGSYAVTITGGGCVVSDTVTIAQPAAMQLSASVTQQPTTCSACDGSATVTVNGTGSPGPHTFLWSNGNTTATAFGLCAGLYIVTVTDATLCQDTVHVHIVNPLNLSLTLNKTNAQCNGFANGAAGVDVTNGTAPYTYAWSRGTPAGADSVYALSAGAVTVTVTDSAGCFGIDSITILENTQITFGPPLTSKPACYGGTDGDAQVNPQGGTPPYTYAWSAGTPDSTGTTVTGLAAGTVYVTVTDGNICTAIDTITITQPDSLYITGIVNNGICGQANGSIDITVVGGTQIYVGPFLTNQYIWSNGSISEDITNLFGGTYSVTVLDENACSATANFTVQQQGTFTVTTQTTNTSSCSSCNGTATVTVSVGAMLPVVYQWSTGQNLQTANNLCPGVYRVTVTDMLGCIDTAVVVINADTNTITLGITSVGPTCANPVDSVTLHISGATPPHFVDWGDGMMTPTYDTVVVHFYSLPDIYLISVTDSLSCVQSIYDTVQDVSIHVAQVEMVQPTCGASNGKIQVTGTDGIAPYTYAWNTGATVDSIEAIVSGSYTVTVTDSAGCVVTETFVLNQNNLNISVSTNITRPTCTATNGKVVAVATNGTPPYTFSWNTGATVDSIVNLAAGTYSVTVTDSLGCAASRTAMVVADQQGLAASVTSTVSSNCIAGGVGSLTIQATGGTAPYIYLWSNGQTGPTLNGGSGSYNYTVTDVNGCLLIGSASIPYTGNNFYVYISAVQPNCGTPGSLTAQVNGGLPPFTYIWSTNPPQTTQTATGLGTGFYSVTVTSSAGCTRTGTYTLTSICSNVISGSAFFDGNGNCVRDAGEPLANGITVMAKDGPRTYYGSVNAAGNYNININMSGNFTLHAQTSGNPGCNALTLCGTSGAVSFPGVGDTAVVNFGVSGTTGSYDLTMHPGWTTANPGFTKDYWIYYQNQLSTPFTGTATIRFEYDTNLTYVSALAPQPVHDAVNHTLTWTVSNVPQNITLTARPRVTFSVPATLSPSYQLQSRFHISPTSADCDSTDNHLYFSEPITSSLDPNAKEVLPAGGITENDSVLTYTIHFQNTGTDTTHFVILRDTLSEHLDAGSAKTIASSHHYEEFTVSGEGILTWIFNPIYLPDSATDEPGSKGFVKFVIRKKTNLPIGTEIDNNVSIYFDYNSPIVTNMVKSTIVDPNWIFEPGVNTVDVRAVPNPFSDFTMITVKGLDARFDFVLYDLMGKQAEYIAGIQTSTFEVRRNDLPQGVYFYRIASGGKIVANGKVVIALK